ncbi:MAG: NADH-quinone oxidoreductase subunit I [Acidobacteria bacterium]|nr:NADH-quinone oxidoreductase subunit I [Acidobacteriota bacterium]
MLTYFRNIGQGIMTIVSSMAIAGRHLFTPSVTLQYPKEKWLLPERSRMRLMNKIEDCIGCGQCARSCPTECILVKTEKRGKEEAPVFASDGTAKKLRTYVFDIDMALCCYCGLCTFACPTQCLIMTGEYEYSVYDKDEHIYHFAAEKPLTVAGESRQNPPEG